MKDKYSVVTWLLILVPLTVFIIITIWVIDLLFLTPQWRQAVPAVIGFAVAFLGLGVFIRGKFGKFVF
ncbi:hypothetical protein SULI_07605 [Saccharolobus solfataricus]|uniref:Uncharacterized protein n=2 Tax=Saccharolobus solfataricus TaxID=2287 RepID=A0A0E3GTG8_SACSO|nr:hypothetical protein [Saccharolobus solfataricus]AKA73796.1 hypothetical protein SULB_1528 [Saccharolobus solfataricus]AKA76493.1 hypothetical protein SULC_1526 [Saccharolobus solfataricus]AKA79186.1 hypothetical protein SULA_1527 [Saccharolobus solfataricus]AZF68272.1 hypothetical protein SULG_07605 [Saccharolobus solfataricus]AZF70892.1 hypothetical protein SULH_07605 [Saccharolobus solfataricus]